MKEQDLIALGFEKRICDEDGQDWYYYIYRFVEHLELISSDSDEAEKNGWYVEFFEVENKIRFTNIRELAKLITLIENAKI